MTSSIRASAAAGREEFAERLLKGSVKKSYAPIVDIDWDAPLDPDKFFLPPETVSLYGTPLWENMTRAQQVELSRQELVNTLSAGIWFENMLNQALLRKMMHQDPTARATHYELTELDQPPTDASYLLTELPAIDEIPGLERSGKNKPGD